MACRTHVLVLMLVALVSCGGGTEDAAPTASSMTPQATPVDVPADPAVPEPEPEPTEGVITPPVDSPVDEGGDASPGDPPAPTPTPVPAPYGTFTPVRQDAATFPTPPPYGHYVYLPSTYDVDTTRRWPVIIFFPGTGEFGNGTTELDKLLLRGLPKVVSRGDLPESARQQFIVIAAQVKGYPSVSELDAFFAWVDAQYRIDPTRRYLTGLSAGGITTWNYGRNGGRQVAAYVPFSAKNGAGTACAFAHRPIWIFHGRRDGNANTPVSASIDAWNAVNSCPVDELARLTVIVNGGHDDLSWVPVWDLSAMTDGQIDPAYDPYDESIYSWLLRHHL